MIGLIASGTVNRFAGGRLLSLRQLLHVCWLVARYLVPLSVLCLIGLGVLHFLYLRNPARTDGMRQLSIDHFIVLEQIRRAAEVPAPDVAFFGDSSCLMGVDAKAIERALKGKSTQSFCTLAYLGPVGYAKILDDMIIRNAAPKAVFFMFHPAAFRRESSWEYWPAFVMSARQAAPPLLPFPRGALDYLQFEWLSRLIYSPLPAAYGRYYGGEGSFRATINARQGSAIDPNTGLNTASVDAVRAVPTPPSGTAFDLSINQAYRDALKVLSETVKKLPQSTPVYLIVSPLPDYTFGPGSVDQRAERALEIALALGIGSNRILSTPATMCAAYFASITHLNRWGQQVYSAELAKQLAEVVK
ncbi:hypothetical protein MA20_43420 [Bradyrhizobium japonicum]|uniref:Uncharacterized protein n=1 Tax=Bradyrhizobium japonicum TaxID=375 RepID=A0A0A3XGU9_BRAJP|nr:hypothetical protein [Bradyrhizobium japonicum]KGT73652.1 hypothetical protein MA20_43420 [Bradyrhizobium japonicum]